MTDTRPDPTNKNPNVECLQCGWTFIGNNEYRVKYEANMHERTIHNGSPIRWERIDDV